MPTQPKYRKEYNGITREQLTKRYIEKLKDLPQFKGFQAPSTRHDLLMPGERCFIINIRYQANKFEHGFRVMPYFVHAPNPEEALEKLVFPAFAKWQGHKDVDLFPKIYTGLAFETVTISLATYMEIFRTAHKFGALFEGPDMCPHVFVGAKHDDKGNLKLLSQEFFAVTKLRG